MSAVLDDNDNYRAPIQIVRPLRDLEPLPFYSTEELLLGVCHVFPRAVRPTPAIASEHHEIAQEKLKPLLPKIKAMLLDGAPNDEIPATLEISRSYLGHAIASDKELRELSRKRKKVRAEERETGGGQGE